MDQVFQLQQQLQRLRQEINDISQVCSTLQQSEQVNTVQLQQLQQKEMMATQGLRRIQQAANSLNQDLNQISSIAQQMAGQLQNRAFSTNFANLSSGINPYSGIGTSGQAGAFAGQNVFAGQSGIYSGAGGTYAGQMGQTNYNQLGTAFPTENQFSYASNLASGQNTGITSATTPFTSMGNSLNPLFQNTYTPYQANQYGFR
jgi:hypothetical protein